MAVQHAFGSFFAEFWRRVPRRYLFVFALDTLAILCALYSFSSWSLLPSLPATTTVVNDRLVVTKQSELLRAGDTIISIAGIDVRNIGSDHSLVARAISLKNAGDSVSLAIARGGSIIPITVKLSRLLDRRAILAHASYALVWFLLGVAIFLVRPNDISSLLFHCVGIGLLFQELSQVPLVNHWPLIVNLIPHAFLLLNSVAVLHFLLVFPRVRSWRRYVLAPFYIGFTICFVATEYLVVRSATGFYYPPVGLLEAINLQRILYPIMNVAGVVLVLYSYISSKNRAERKRLRWTLSGGVIALLWQAATLNIPRMLGMSVEMDPWFAYSGLFTAPIGIAIGLVWYNVFDIDLLLSRTLVYAIVLGLLVITYEAITEALVLVLGSGFSGGSSLIISIVATTAIAVGFDPVKERIEQVINGLFFRFTGDENMAPETKLEAIRELVEKHGGVLELVAESEEAAEFTLRIPNAK
jgi:hypothetical protein